MQVNNVPSAMTQAAGSTSSASSSSGATNSTSLANPNLFITLLTAQLQAQDPTNPMSPEQMVNQLTEVSSLQQLISINQTLTNISTGNVPAATSSTNPTGAIQ